MSAAYNFVLKLCHYSLCQKDSADKEDWKTLNYVKQS
jgi:hypothetical protein